MSNLKIKNSMSDFYHTNVYTLFRNNFSIEEIWEDMKWKIILKTNINFRYKIVIILFPINCWNETPNFEMFSEFVNILSGSIWSQKFISFHKPDNIIFLKKAIILWKCIKNWLNLSNCFHPFAFISVTSCKLFKQLDT